MTGETERTIMGIMVREWGKQEWHFEYKVLESESKRMGFGKVALRRGK